QDIEPLSAFILDQCLLEVGLLVDDIDEVIDHTALTSHDQVEIAQAHVKIDNHGFIAPQRQTGGDSGAGGGFSYAAFSRGDNNDLSHKCSLLECCNLKGFVFQIGLRRLFPATFTQHIVEHEVSGNRHQFGFQLLTENPGIRVAADPCQSPSAQCAVDVNIAI